MLTNWDFKDETTNSTTQQINRQKSARNLEIVQFDPSEPRAVFFDPKRGTKNTATLSECGCNDFNFAGTSPRKEFKPCMHIYRLAIELGLIEAKYLDHDARFALVGVRSRLETERLQRLLLDSTQWGDWSSEIHASGIQRNRQYRAYLIIFAEQNSIRQSQTGWMVHDYNVRLNQCDCMDFCERRLPCKHIYAAALAAGISLPLSQSECESAREKGFEIVFEFPTGH
jgi:hypothetical protein